MSAFLLLFGGLTGAASIPPPVNSIIPTIDYAPDPPTFKGIQITSDGMWTNSPTAYTYEWFADNVTTGQTGSIFEFGMYPVDTVIFCRVTATNAGGFASADSGGIQVQA